MTGSDRQDDGIVRALGPHLGVALYDPVVAVVMRERLFRGRLVAQVIAGAPGVEPLDVVELGCGTGTNAIRLAAARVIGVDADPEILRRARGKAGARRSSGAPAGSRTRGSPMPSATASSSRWCSITCPTPPVGDAPGRPSPAPAGGPYARRRRGPSRGTL